MIDAKHPDARILLVDDEPLNITLLERILAAGGYRNIRSTTDPRQVLALTVSFEPDLLLLDLNMPHLDGFGVMQQVTSRVDEGDFFPVLVLTADATNTARDRALSEGAHDFLTKPLDHAEVLLRIRNLLDIRDLQQQLRIHNRSLESVVRERTKQLSIAHMESLERLSRVSEYRDDNTHEHTERVGRSSAAIAKKMGWADDQITIMRQASPLHDIGKIGTPDSILLKPGKLTDEEFEVIREHVSAGARILSGSRSPVLQMAEAIALAHHERWDGTGYLNLKGVDIPLAARIVSVSDVYDALTNARPYKEAWPVERALEELRNQRGRHFDPEVLDAFFSIHDTL